MKTLLLVILCIPVISRAQISQNVTKQFPAHIVLKIDDVNSKINLSEDKQIRLGKKLFTADSLANISLTKGESVSKLKSYNTVDIAFLKPILSPEELDIYAYEINKDNRFLVALKFAKELKLDAKQISDIRKQNDSFDSFSKLSSKEIIGFYNTKLNLTLSKKQYNSLLNIIYKDQSLVDAKTDWGKIVKLKILTDENNKTELSKIINYHLAKNTLLDLKSERYDKATLVFLTNKISIVQPPILLHANILTDDIPIKNIYSSVIKYEKELKLTKVQIDTLLSDYIKLERSNFERKENSTALNPPRTAISQYEDIIQILTIDQVNIWMIKKDEKLALKEAEKNWNLLELEGLTKDLDKDKTIQEFSNYQLQHLVSKEKALVYRTQEAVSKLREIEQNKPALLKQLDAINRSKSKSTNTKNALTW